MLTHCIDAQIATPARVWPGLADRCARALRSERCGQGEHILMLIYVRFFFFGWHWSVINSGRMQFLTRQ